MAKPPETKKEKEKKQRDKLRKDNWFYENVRRMMGSTERTKELSETPEKKPEKQLDDKNTERLTSIRNRIDNSRRVAVGGWAERMGNDGDSGLIRTR